MTDFCITSDGKILTLKETDYGFKITLRDDSGVKSINLSKGDMAYICLCFGDKDYDQENDDENPT